MPAVSEKKVNELNEPELEGPPTLADVTAAFDGIYLGLKNMTVSFPRPIGRLSAAHSIWYH